jgi:hypothetical protein
MIRDNARASERAERIATEALAAGTTTLDAVLGTGLRYMMIAWLGSGVAAFCGCALYFALLGR